MKIKNECTYIYKEAFGNEDADFREALFENCFENCKYLIKNGKVVSQLFALECDLILNEKIIPAIYIYAVATLKSEQGKGYMTELLENIKQDFPEHFLFLRPANEGLFEFYSRFGFKTVKAKSESSDKAVIKPKNNFKAITTEIVPNAQSFTLMYHYNKEINETINFIYSME